jgi:hypothetical protein
MRCRLPPEIGAKSCRALAGTGLPSSLLRRNPALGVLRRLTGVVELDTTLVSLLKTANVAGLSRGRGRRPTSFDCSARCVRCVHGSLRSLCPWLAALAAMFARKPPSSSDPTKRSCREIQLYSEAFRRLLLQHGGANIAGARSPPDAFLRHRSATFPQIWRKRTADRPARCRGRSWFQ